MRARRQIFQAGDRLEIGPLRVSQRAELPMALANVRDNGGVVAVLRVLPDLRIAFANETNVYIGYSTPITREEWWAVDVRFGHMIERSEMLVAHITVRREEP